MSVEVVVIYKKQMAASAALSAEAHKQPRSYTQAG